MKASNKKDRPYLFKIEEGHYVKIGPYPTHVPSDIYVRASTPREALRFVKARLAKYHHCYTSDVYLYCDELTFVGECETKNRAKRNAGKED